MLEKLQDVPAGVVGVKGSGTLSREDYERVFLPILDDARREGHRMRFLYQLGPDFKGFQAGAAWEDAKLGLRSLGLFEACAVVTDIGWVREATRLAGFVMPCPVRVFANRDAGAAAQWLGSLPQEVGISHRLLADRGVIVIDVKEALHAQDFDALAMTADSWIESHGLLQGLVIHAHAFPGWENLGSLVRHVQFIRDHHRRIGRIALAADTPLANLAPRLGEHFIQAEVKNFTYDQLDAAVEWAGGKDAHGPS